MLTDSELEEYFDELWVDNLKGKSYKEVENQYRRVSEVVGKIKQSKMSEEEMQQLIDETQSQTVLVELIRNQEVSEKFIRHNEKLMTDFCWIEANMSVRYSERYMKYLIKKEFISWDEVAMFQPIKKEFAIKYAEALHIPYLQSNENIDQDDFEENGIYVALTLIQL
jgi:hypothetical protein